MHPTAPAATTPAPASLGARERLEFAEWREREARHEARADELSRGWRERVASGTKHPVDDFLFTYYPVRPGILRRWHPGAAVVLADASAEPRAEWRWYSSVGTGVEVDALGFVRKAERTLRFIRHLLSDTAARPAQLSCFGLHEWAMVYRAGDASPDGGNASGGGRRHDVPLRLSAADTDSVVESHRISCSHFDAFRFFTPEAVSLNRLQPTRESQPDLEQPGCLHAGMDVYKWATKLGPLVAGEVLLDSFELARDIRELDMRASPYDLEAWGYSPVRIETAEGKAEYSRAQREFAERANAVRSRVVEAIDLAMDL